MITTLKSLFTESKHIINRTCDHAPDHTRVRQSVCNPKYRVQKKFDNILFLLNSPAS